MSVVKLILSKTTKQTSFLFATNIVLLLIGLLLKNTQTQLLTPEQYGNYAFFTTVVNFLVLFFGFGFFSSIQVLLAENNSTSKEKELIGIGTIISLISGILFSIALWILAFFIDDFFRVELKETIQLFAPFCFLFVFKQYIPAVSTGTNKVETNPISEIISRIVFLVFLIALPKITTITLETIIFLNISTLLLSVIYIYIKFSPSFKNLKSNFETVLDKNKTFGFPLYVGQTAQQSTFKFDEIFIPYFVNITQLGYYSLAKFITMPMVLMSQALSTSLYKFFSKTKKIPQKVFVFNTLWLAFCILFLWATKDIIVKFIFGKEYIETANYILPLSIAFLFQGLYQPFTFLTAKSQGKEVRNIAIAEAVVNILGNLILIPIYGVMGAIAAITISKATNFVGLLYYYQKYLKKI